MEINFQNIEEIIFFDKKVKEMLPEFRHLFDQWQLGKTIPALGGLGSRSVLDLLNSLESEHLEKLEKYFRQKVTINKIDNSIVKNYSFSPQDSDDLCGFIEYKEFCAYRSKDSIHLSFWR
jgi:hypothetical protein